MDLLLVSPPVANVGQAAASSSVRTAWLRARGWSVGQWDASIDAFHHFHSAPYLAIGRDRPATEGASASAIGAASSAAAEIEDAKRRLRDPRTVADLTALERAFGVLEAAGDVLSARGRPGTTHTYRTFDIAGAYRDWDSLVAALDDPVANPYVDWADEQAIPRILGSGARSVGVSITYLSQVLPGFTLVRRLRKHAPNLPLAIGGGYLTAMGDEAREIPRTVLPVDRLVLHDAEAPLDAWLATLTGREGVESDACPCWTADGLDLTRYLVPRYAIPLPLARGCHWGRCRYCNISSQTSASYRVRPVESAIRDLRAATEETGSNWFDLPTDSFRPDHLHALAKAVLSERLDIRWAAEILLHPALTTEVIEDLARSGCVCLRFGVESASLEVLAAMNKPRPVGLAERILRDCRRFGIRTSAMLIVGFPTETQRQRNETFDFLVEHRGVIDFVALHEFNLVPGSPMADDPARYGLIVPPKRAVLRPSLPYRNANGIGLDGDQVHEAASAMRDALREHYPHLGKPWAVAIGGWMTFPWCCLSKPDPIER